jgi:putative toxin-antitoxin system antitoxin component (TIGR02293 family)
MPTLTLSPATLFDDARMAKELRLGLPVAVFFRVREALGVSQELLARAISIPPRTVMRRQEKKQRFKADESERLLRLARIFVRARQVLESEERARAWMFAKNRALGGATPLDFARTEPGAREVENVLGRIEHGVFS